jgi:CDP-diacylglycerol---glycerol-3-phosphate 3-phosphatidyltransferase
MTSGSRWTLPNTITVLRILACPGLAWLALSTSLGARAWAVLLFLAAAISDIWDGYLARKHGWITDIGKLLDPFADKLLLVSTFVPVYLISHRPGDLEDIPFWGPMPLWVLIVIFGRELAITVFRSWAQRRGVIIAAGPSGKQKAAFQFIFMGAVLIWYPLQQLVIEREWYGQIWDRWSAFHSAVIASTLAIAVILTVWSAFDYYRSYRSLVREAVRGSSP